MKISLHNIHWDFLSEEGKKWICRKKGLSIEGLLIKPSTKRSVFYIPSDGIYIKIFGYRTIDSVKKNITGGKGVKEGKIGLELAQKEIPAPEVLGYGRVKSSGRLIRDIVVTKEVRNSMRLSVFNEEIFPGLTFIEKRKVIRIFAAFFQNLHHRGIFHQDINSGNILAKKVGAEYEFVLLDLDKVQLKKTPLSMNNRVENLAVLLQFLWPVTTLSQRFRFLKYYAMDESFDVVPSTINAIRLRTLKKYHQRGKERSRHCRSNHAKFRNIYLPGFRIFCYRKYDADVLVHQIISDPAGFFRNLNEPSVNKEKDQKIISINGKSYKILFFDYTGILDCVKNSLKISTGAKTWGTSFGFKLRKLPLPDPIVYAEQRRRGLIRKAWMIYDWPDNLIPLHQFWTLQCREEKRTLLIRLALLIGRMHQLGCRHGELWWQNILIRHNEAGDTLLLHPSRQSKIRRRLKITEACQDLKPFFLELKKHSPDDCVTFLKTWHKWSLYRSSVADPDKINSLLNSAI